MTRAEFQTAAPLASRSTLEANGFFCDADGGRCDVTGRPAVTMVAAPPFALESETPTPSTPPQAFFLNCLPPTVTAQQKGAFIIPPDKGTTGKGSIRFFTKPEVAKAERLLESLLRPHAPRQPREGPIRLSVTFCWPWRAGEPQRNRHGARWRDTQPDASNLIKGLEDCMTRCGFWKNDGQIADLQVRKEWSGKPGISVEIESLGETR